MDIWYFARICARARSWHEFAKCRFTHFPSFFSLHVDTYVIVIIIVISVIIAVLLLFVIGILIEI